LQRDSLTDRVGKTGIGKEDAVEGKGLRRRSVFTDGAIPDRDVVNGCDAGNASDSMSWRGASAADVESIEIKEDIRRRYFGSVLI
jgi:hypothetical protein